jgi:hypothetical protein
MEEMPDTGETRMNRIATRWLMGLALLATGALALPVQANKASKQNGSLTVFDEAKLFTASGLDKAKAAMNSTTFDQGLTVTIDTYEKIPENKKGAYSDANKERFFKEWAKELATSDKAKGIYVLVCRHPGYVEVIADKRTRDRGFTHEDEMKLRDTLLTAFRDAAKEMDEAKQFAMRDAGLHSAVSFVISDLKDTTAAAHGTANTAKSGGGFLSGGIGSLICLGLFVLLGAWLVIGLIRAFSGGSGGGPGGGGGGGFMSSMFGGLFGAMAGMYLYNSMFGAGGMFGGSDAFASDGSGDAGASGDGDFSGDTGAGGSFDGGEDRGWGGGGDWGGDGGDFGGGGDF